MADDVQDVYIATEAGDAGWQSLTELTASKVDAKLPIESVDGTVVLSDSDGSFVVSTGNPSAERVTVSKDGNIGIGVAPAATVGVYYQHAISGSSIASFLADNMIESSTGAASYFRSRASISAGVTVANLRHFSADAKNIKGTATEQVAYFCDDLGDGAYSFYAEKNAAYIKDIHTSSVSGLNSNDASVTLGENVGIAGTTNTPLRMTSTNDACLIRYQGAANKGWFAGSAGATFVVSGGDNGNNQIIITPDDNVKIPTKIITPSVSGVAESNASVTLGDQATLTKADGSEYVVTDAASIATKKYCDDKIWVGTTAQYNALATKNNTTLYCLTD